MAITVAITKGWPGSSPRIVPWRVFVLHASIGSIPPGVGLQRSPWKYRKYHMELELWNSGKKHLVTWPGKLSHNYGKSPFLIGKSTMSMAIFNSYVSLPDGRWGYKWDIP